MADGGFEGQKEAVKGICRDALELLSGAKELSIGREVGRALAESLERLETGRFQIAFVGQMKAGKSTLVNAMVFGRQVLPVASTPQTAKLTLVQYQAEPSALVRFYTRAQWDELTELGRQEAFAASGGETADFSYKRMVDEAREQVGPELERLLGTARQIPLDGLGDYVAAYDPEVPQGRYVSITHTVEVQYPHTWPVETEFVDTPGINDPNILRERVTLDYLRQADAVILVLYGGRPGDREDINFLKRTLLPIGFNRIIVALNKWDMVPVAEGKSIRAYLREMLQENVIEAAKRADIELPAGFEQILDLEHIYPVSGMRALLGRSEADIPDGAFYFKRTCVKKGIATYAEAVTQSGVVELEAGLLGFLMEQKGRELLMAPLRKADGAVREVVRRADQARERASAQLRDMRKSEEELREDLKGQRRKLGEVEGSIKELEVLLRRWTRQQLERAQSDAVRRVKSFVEDVQQGFIRRIDNIGTMDVATTQAHVLELNTDLAWRTRTLHDELEQVMTEGLLRLRRRLQGDLQDEIRQRIPDYHASPWIMEDVDAIGRMDFPIELPPLSELETDSPTFWHGVQQLLRATEYRARLKEELRRVSLDYEASCLQYVKRAPLEVEEAVLGHVSGIMDHVRSHVQDRIDDIQRVLAEREGQMEEAAERGEQLEAELARHGEIVRQARALIGQIEGQSGRLEPAAG